MPDNPLSRDELAALAEFDTPTICNALEVVAPERRASASPPKPWSAPFRSESPWSAMRAPA